MTLRPGDIICIDCAWLPIDHDKFLLTLSTEPKARFAYINSRIHPFIEKRPALRECQVVIDRAAHTFLRYDSFIDVSGMFERMNGEFQRIIQQISTDPARHKGRCSTGVLRTVLSTVNQAETISVKAQRSIQASLLPYVR